METRYPTFLFSYPFQGAKWSFEIIAKDADEAQERLKALGWATYDGELVARIPAVASSFVMAAVCWLRNLLYGKGN